MLLSVESILIVAQSSSEIPEGLMNNPVYLTYVNSKHYVLPPYILFMLYIAIRILFFILHTLSTFVIYTFLIAHLRNLELLKTLLENTLRIQPW